MAIKLVQGTIETVPVDVNDRTETLTDLSDKTPIFWFQKDDDSYVYNGASATAVSMRVYCLIDTSASGPGGLLAIAHYRLFVGFSLTTPFTEDPKLGPVDVYIIDSNQVTA